MKLIIKILLSLFVLFLVLVTIAVFFGERIIEKGVVKAANTYGPDITGTPFSLEDIDLSLLGGSVKVTGLTIGSPEGFNAPHIMKVGTAEVKLKVSSLAGSPIVIDRIFVSGPEIIYERKLQGSNLAKLQENLSKGKSAEPQPSEETPPAEPEEPASSEASDLKVQINDFQIEDAKLSVAGMNTQLTLPLPPIHLTDIGTEEGGVSPDNAAKVIISAILRASTQAVTDNAGKLFEGGGDQIDKAKNTLKKLFGGGDN